MTVIIEMSVWVWLMLAGVLGIDTSNCVVQGGDPRTAVACESTAVPARGRAR